MIRTLTLQRLFVTKAYQWPVTGVCFTPNSSVVFASCGSECKNFAVRKTSGTSVVVPEIMHVFPKPCMHVVESNHPVGVDVYLLFAVLCLVAAYVYGFEQIRAYLKQFGVEVPDLL